MPLTTRSRAKKAQRASDHEQEDLPAQAKDYSDHEMEELMAAIHPGSEGSEELNLEGDGNERRKGSGDKGEDDGEQEEDPNASEVYLEYETCRLLNRDRTLVEERGDGWFADSHIQFWIDYLRREHLHEDPDGDEASEIVFLKPSVVQHLKHLKLAEIKKILQPGNLLQQLQRAQYIFLPISDNEVVETTDDENFAEEPQRLEGKKPMVVDPGNHWSLVLIDKETQSAHHYDSMPNGYNQKEATKTIKMMGQMLGLKLKLQQSEKDPKTSDGVNCGVIVCVIMKHLVMQLRYGERLALLPNGLRHGLVLDGMHVNPRIARESMLFIWERLRERGGEPGLEDETIVGGE